MLLMARWQLWSSWVLQIVAAIILLQTLFFKFTGASESVYIFSLLGMEPWGRFASGAAELVAGILILVPGYAHAGAELALVVILGAIVAHLTVLGIVLPQRLLRKRSTHSLQTSPSQTRHFLDL